MAAGAYGCRQLHRVGDEMDAFSKRELFRRPEVKYINTYVILRTYVLTVLKGIGALVLLWATVVLLGGFVSSLQQKDFWYISFISFVQAAGMANAFWDRRLNPLATWMFILEAHIKVKRDDYGQRRQTSFPRHVWSWWRLVISKAAAMILFYLLSLVLSMCFYGPLVCAGLSYWRIRRHDYGSGNKDGSEANLKPGMDLFYFLCVAQGIVFLVVVPVEIVGTYYFVWKVSQKVGLSREEVFEYCVSTKRKYLKDLAESSDVSWNLITYGSDLLDSEMPEDNVSGARVLAKLIEQGTLVRRQLLRSPRGRIQKLFGTLAWTSPAEGEMRWFAAKIVEHVAHGLSLSQFPGALECVFSLLDTSVYDKDGVQEAVTFVAQLRLDKKQQAKQKGSSRYTLLDMIVDKIRKFMASEKQDSIKRVEGTNEDLILLGMRILENLALDEHNCKAICRTDDLLSKIIAPVSSGNLIQDIEKNTAWAKVTDGSLKLVIQLMRSPGDTGKMMRHKVAGNNRAVNNLEEVLRLQINSPDVMALQIRAIEILEQLFLVVDSAATTNLDSRERTRESLSTRLLHIFLTDEWMEDYILKIRQMIQEEIARQLGKGKRSSKKREQAKQQAQEENKMKAAQDTVIQMKEKAGDGLVTLCMGSQADSDYIIRRLLGCGEAVRYLTEMLGSEERTTRCRYSAAVILEHLCTRCTTLDRNYIKETTLKKVLRKVLHIDKESQATRTSTLIKRLRIISQGHQKRAPVRTYKEQYEERTLQVALLSLCRAMIHTVPDFADVVAELVVSPKDLSEKLKKIVEESRCATVSSLATVKLTCEIVRALIPHDHLDINMKDEIVKSLGQASETMAGLESCMHFAGIPVKPSCSDLVMQAQEALEKRQRTGDRDA